MSKLPRSLKPAKVIKALQKVGFEVDHITGSHYIMKRDSLRISVPYHKTIRTGTLRAILRQTGLSLDEFIELL